MLAEQEQRILDRLAYIAAETKTFDSRPAWVKVPYRFGARWQAVVEVRVAGALMGTSIRLRTPVDVWEEDVYGQVEVRLPNLRRAFRIDALEWKPLHPHDNSPHAPPAHRGLRLFDRYHPFELNQSLGLKAFSQTGISIAVPLPGHVGSFVDYIDMCANVWRCADMLDFPPPDWSRPML